MHRHAMHTSAFSCRHSFFLQQISGFESQILAALVDGTTGSQQMNPPSGGWPTGSGFRVNLVQDAQDLNTILAQSGTFSIVNPASSQSYVVIVSFNKDPV